MSGGVPFRLNKYISRNMFDVILLSTCYTDIVIGSFICTKWNRRGIELLMMDLIRHVLMYCTIFLCIGSISMLPGLIMLGLNLYPLVIKCALFIVILLLFCGYLIQWRVNISLYLSVCLQARFPSPIAYSSQGGGFPYPEHRIFELQTLSLCLSVYVFPSVMFLVPSFPPPPRFTWVPCPPGHLSCLLSPFFLISSYPYISVY